MFAPLNNNKHLPNTMERTVTFYVGHPALTPNMASANKPGPDDMWNRASVWKQGGRWYWMTTKNGIQGTPLHRGCEPTADRACQAAAVAMCGPQTKVRYA